MRIIYQLMEWLVPNASLIVKLLVLCGIILAGYAVAYFTQKGKMHALGEKNDKLQKELEKLKHDYNERLYIFQKRSEIYEKFLSMLDNLNRDTENKTGEFQVIYTRFTRDIMVASENQEGVEKIPDLYQQFSLDISRLVDSYREDFTKIKNETNFIKLVGSEEVISLLEKLEKLVFEKLNLNMTVYTTLATHQYDHNSLQDIVKLVTSKSSEIDELKKAIIQIMRHDLNVGKK